MRTIIESSLKLRFMVVTAAVALVIVGFTGMGNTPTDLLPEFSPTMVEIQTEALGLSAAEVEQLITVPLEADLLNGVAWLDTISSQSIASLSSIKLRFLPGTDPMAARQMVQERLTQAHGLPNVSKPPVMLQPLSSTSRVFKVGLRSKTLSLIELSVLARWNIRPRLMGVPGVANVLIWGQRKRQLQVLVDPARIKDAGISLADVVSTTGNALWVSPLSFLDASSPGTGGFIDTPNQRLGVRHVLPITSPEGLANVIVEGSDRRLSDVTEVIEGHQPLIGDAIVGDDTGIMLVIEKFPRANTVEVTHAVEKALEELRPGLEGVEIDTRIFRPAGFIEQAVGNLGKALVLAGILMTLGLLLLFFEVRVALIAITAIAISLLSAWFVSLVRGVAVDMLTLTGLMIATGAVVGDAIAGVQNIRRRLAEDRPAGATAWSVVADATTEIRYSLGFATLMVLLLVVPMFFIGGTMGAFTLSVAVSYTTAVLVSMVIAVTLTPTLAFLLLPGRPYEIKTPPLGGMFIAYCRDMALRFSNARVPILMGVGLLAVAMIYPRIRSEISMPMFRETDLLIRWDAKPGASLPAMNRITSALTGELREIPGVRNVGAHVGRAVASDRIVGSNASSLWVSIDPKADYDEALEAIEAVVEGYPGLDDDISTYTMERIEASMEEDDEIIVRVYGQDTDVLLVEARKLEDTLSDIEGVTEIEIDRSPVEPTVRIRVDMARARQYGIKPGDVRRAAATLLSGLEVGNLFEDKKVFDVVVWGVPEVRASVSDIRNLVVESPSGEYVQLAEVADVGIEPHPIILRREGVARYVDMEISVHGRGLEDVAGEIARQLDVHPFPMEYHATLPDDFNETEATRYHVIIAMLIASVGILLLLQAALRSWPLAGAVFLAVPVAPLGGVLLLFVTGMDVTVGALAGLLAVSVLALREATLLFGYYQRLEHHAGIAFGRELVARGTSERAISILASIIVTALAVLPFLLYQGSAGLELVAPMAGVILAGLVTTSVLLLFVLPTLYLAFGANAVADEDLEDLRAALHGRGQ